MATFPLTPKGYENLKKELHHLKTVERLKISKEIGAAIELGDLSENFEYHSSKDKQGLIEAKIRVLEGQLATSEVIDPTKLSGDRVVFGAIVTLINVETDEERIFQIVGETEGDIKNGKISINAPLVRALIGKNVGDEVRLPGKSSDLVEISDISFPKSND